MTLGQKQELGETTSLNQILEQFPDEWLLLEVIEKDIRGKPSRVRLLAHSKDRAAIYKAIPRYPDTSVALYFTGKVPEEGYIAVF